MQLIIQKIFKSADEALELINDSVKCDGHKVICVSPVEGGGLQVHIKGDMREMVKGVPYLCDGLSV